VPKPPVTDAVAELLARPNPSVITSVRPDGQPVSVATWYLFEDGRVLVNMDEGRKRIEYMRNDPRVTITVLADGDWYTHVSLQGRVVQWDDDTDLTQIDRISRHYTGDAYPVRDRERVGAWIEVERWHGWGAAEATDTQQSSGGHHRS
jgi:PPOX class probable F420-dependent enzyme